MLNLCYFDRINILLGEKLQPEMQDEHFMMRRNQFWSSSVFVPWNYDERWNNEEIGQVSVKLKSSRLVYQIVVEMMKRGVLGMAVGEEEVEVVERLPADYLSFFMKNKKLEICY